MILGIQKVIEYIGSCLGMILSLQIPDGYGSYITFRQLILFLFLLSCSYAFIKLFLTKGFKRYGKD